MHGRPRKPLSDGGSQEKDMAKAAGLQSLQTQFFKNHHEKIYTKEALQLNAKLLEINPEIYTAWNYRKLAIKQLLESESDSAVIKQSLDEELRVVERALKRNHKSYGAWHHRKWVINMGYSSLDHEFQLLDQLLKADSRNFHGWNYRRFVADKKKSHDEDELKFTTKKINENFSNYSAWHNRSAILSHMLKNKYGGISAKEQEMTEEYELVRQALFTDSEDQSGWFYHLWLLGQTIAPIGPKLEMSWPCNGSQLVIDFNEQSHAYVSDFDTPFGTDRCMFSEGIPLVLHFSEPVKGVNASTVSVNSLLLESESLVWRPISPHGLQAKTWVTLLKLPSTNSRVGETYTVQIRVADTLGIISLNGYNFACPAVLNFSLDVHTRTIRSTGGNFETVPLAWEGENYSPLAIDENKFPIELHLGSLSIDGSASQENTRWQQETLDREIKVCRELLEIEMDSKWAKITLARLLIAQDMLSGGSILRSKRMHTDEVLQLFNDLIEIDPSHAEYYKDQFSLILLDKVSSRKQNLQEYCWDSKGTGSFSNGERNKWLRLHGLSLSRIGSLEKLLWVQRLDISHNRLRSIDGLEALQLLGCLNLSHNLLANFTALGPLRQIKTLRALNIAYNKIGAHTVNSTRFSFPSALNNSSISNGDTTRDADEENLEISWEITVAFKGLHLRQLDIAGNPANDEKCRRLLMKTLPSLKWLDGTSIN